MLVACSIVGQYHVSNNLDHRYSTQEVAMDTIGSTTETVSSESLATNSVTEVIMQQDLQDQIQQIIYQNADSGVEQVCLISNMI